MSYAVCRMSYVECVQNNNYQPLPGTGLVWNGVNLQSYLRLSLRQLMLRQLKYQAVIGD